MTTATARAVGEQDESCGGRLVAIDGRALPLRETRLKADARGGVARVVLEQRFANPYDDPLAVTYLLPLPADGAVSGFAFRIGERRIVGEVDRREAARERYQQALVEGRSAALVEQDRTSLFTQEVGNIPPRTEVVAEITVDQRLSWLAEGFWEWRFPTAVAPRYQGGPGRVEDAGKLTVEVADRPTGARMFVELAIRDTALEGLRPESASHPMRFSTEAGRVVARLEGDGGAPLDRDVVVRWPAALPSVGISLEAARPAQGKPHAADGFGLLTIVPPRPERQGRPVPRDLIVLLDTSGSMGGEPLAQAKRVVSALVDSLSPRDRLELIEFSNEPRRWKWRVVEATPRLKKKALEWIGSLEASGGTEMREGIFEALKPLRGDAQRQVVLVTDGLIGFESEVVGAILKNLPKGSRLHTVGVGSAVNRSLTGPAARAGMGLEVVIGLGEDPERAARRLLARTCTPLVTDLVLEGSALMEHAPLRLPDLFAGSPVLVGVKLRASGGTLSVRGRTADGEFKDRLEVRAVDFGAGSPAATALFGREKVEDLEMQLAGNGDRHTIDAAVERLGLDFQIATRRTSWIAVSDKQDVDPRQPTRSEKMPHELPFGMSAEGLGLRAANIPAVLGRQATGAAMAPQRAASRPAPSAPRRAAPGPLFKKKAEAPEQERKRSVLPADRGEADEVDADPARIAVAQRVLETAAELEDLIKARADEPAAPEAPAEMVDKEAEADVEQRPTPRKLTPVVEPEGSQAVHGRVFSLRRRDLVLEIFVDARGLEWAPEATVYLTFADGSVLEATVDLSHSTAQGSLVVSQVARLALQLKADAPNAKIARAALMSGGRSIIVEIS